MSGVWGLTKADISPLVFSKYNIFKGHASYWLGNFYTLYIQVSQSVLNSTDPPIFHNSYFQSEGFLYLE